MKFLFGVFDWGLGHATRDTPLIKELLKRGHKIDIIATRRALLILKKNFGNKCRYFNVSSLYYMYSNSKRFKTKFVLSSIKLARSLKEARKKTEKVIKKGEYDIIISDCRYDVYDKPENSYLINHQLRFKAFMIGQAILEMWLASRMDKYKYVLVPDFKNKDLSGKLSHDLRYFDKNKIKYVGVLSNIKKKSIKKDIDYFISLSGPEPARTLLEESILNQIKDLKGKIVIAGGNPEGKNRKVPENVQYYNFVNQKKQEDFMNRAKFLIIRAGYTTIMEIAELGKNALLIPAPGQTEQVYLGEYLKNKKYFYSVDQYKLNLKKDVEKAKEFKGYKPVWKTKDSVKKIIKLIGA